jgi:sporulation protein YlmC with PRC-barrel domain
MPTVNEVADPIPDQGKHILEATMSYLDRDIFGMYKKHHSAGPGPRLMGADTLIGEDVYNLQDENVGDIKEVMLDMQTGEVAYAVLSFGGILGLGEKLFAVPWEYLSIDTVNKRFLLDVDKAQLKQAPGFDKDNWPDMGDADWTNAVQTFFGTRPRTSGRSPNSPQTGRH